MRHLLTLSTLAACFLLVNMIADLAALLALKAALNAQGF